MPRRGQAKRTPGAGAADATENGSSAEVNLEEKTLQMIYDLYTNPSRVSSAFGHHGIEKIAKELGVTGVLHPSRKILVMIVGNHSAGKSSFVNWYVGEEELQSTGVAVESQGFTVVTSGERKDRIKAGPALEMKPHLAGLEKFQNCLSKFDVQVSTSRARDFSNIDFIDTPGLLDGNVGYPIDVQEVMMYIASRSDLVFVFMDPVGQALCTRTMAVVEGLDKRNYSDKTHYYLTKADSVRRSLDLQKVIVQVTANLSKHVKNHHGIDVPSIWIPGHEPRGSGAEGEVSASSNSLGRVVKLLSDTVSAKVQSNLDRLHHDCDALSAKIDAEIASETHKREVGSRWYRYQLFIGWLLLPLVVVASFLDFLVAFQEQLPASVAESQFAKSVLAQCGPGGPFVKAVGALEKWGLETVWERLAAAAVLFLFLDAILQFFAWRRRRLAPRDRKGQELLKEYKVALATMKKRAKSATSEYLEYTQSAEFRK